MATIVVRKNLGGVEDLLFGQGTVSQTRRGSAVTITKINCAHIPYQGEPGDPGYVSVCDKFADIDAQVAALQAAITTINGQITTINTTLSDHETRIVALEGATVPGTGTPGNYATYDGAGVLADSGNYIQEGAGWLATFDGSGNIVGTGVNLVTQGFNFGVAYFTGSSLLEHSTYTVDRLQYATTTLHGIVRGLETAYPTTQPNDHVVTVSALNQAIASVGGPSTPTLNQVLQATPLNGAAGATNYNLLQSVSHSMGNLTNTTSATEVTPLLRLSAGMNNVHFSMWRTVFPTAAFSNIKMSAAIRQAGVFEFDDAAGVWSQAVGASQNFSGYVNGTFVGSVAIVDSRFATPMPVVPDIYWVVYSSGGGYTDVQAVINCLSPGPVAGGRLYCGIDVEYGIATGSAVDNVIYSIAAQPSLYTTTES